MTTDQNTDVFETNDYSREQVPDTATFSGFHIALVIVGGTIGIPVFLMAAEIGSSLGLQDAGKAYVIASFVLGVMAALTSLAGAKSRFSAYLLAEFAFGKSGARIVNMVVALTLIGWYGVTCNVFGQAADQVAQSVWSIELPIWIYSLVGSILMIGVTVSGFKGIDKLALVLVPLMIGFMAYAAYLSFDDIKSWTTSAAGALNFPLAVSAVIGSYIVGVIIQPDYSRFARNSGHAVWAAFIALAVVFPIVQFLASVPSVATNNSDLILIMVMLGIGVPAFLLILLGSWSSNVLSLYSSGLAISTIATKSPLWKIITCVGVVGTAIGFTRAQDYLVDYLVFLGVMIPPIGAIYIIDTLVLRKGNCSLDALETEASYDITAFAAWACAIFVGMLGTFEIYSITSVPAMDSILVAAVIFWCFKRFAEGGKQQVSH